MSRQINLCALNATCLFDKCAKEINKEEVIKLQSKLSSTIKTTRSYQDKGDFLANATAAKEAREL